MWKSEKSMEVSVGDDVDEERVVLSVSVRGALPGRELWRRVVRGARGGGRALGRRGRRALRRCILYKSVLLVHHVRNQVVQRRTRLLSRG